MRMVTVMPNKFSSTFAIVLATSTLAFGAQAKAVDLSTLLEAAESRGEAPPPRPAVETAAPISPLPFAAWVLTRPAGMEEVARAGAGAVNPSVDAKPHDKTGLFAGGEEQALDGVDDALNYARARALSGAYAKLKKQATRKGLKDKALDGVDTWLSDLRKDAAERFAQRFGEKGPKALTWAPLDAADGAMPRHRNQAVDLAIANSPGLNGGDRTGALSHGRFRMRNVVGLDAIGSELGGATGSEGLAIGLTVKLGFEPGALSYADAEGVDAVGARASDRNALKRRLVERLTAAYDARRAHEALAPAMDRRVERLAATIKTTKSPTAVQYGALWTAMAARINARHADAYAKATILAATGRLRETMGLRTARPQVASAQ